MDRLTQKLESMARRDELRGQRLTLRRALELAADVVNATDPVEREDYRDFINAAHRRGDFVWFHELTRRQFQAVQHGRPCEVFSDAEIREIYNRVGRDFVYPTEADVARARTELDADLNVRGIIDPMQRAIEQRRLRPQSAQQKQREAVTKMITVASSELRRYANAPWWTMDPLGKPVPVGFRSMKDPSREENAEEIAAEVDVKLERMENVAEINSAIDLVLERASARMANGEAVMPSSAMLSMLETALGAIIEVSETPNRFTDARMFPRWSALLGKYNETVTKLNAPDRISDKLRRLQVLWDSQDAEFAALAEKVTGSPDPIPPAVLEGGLRMLGFIAPRTRA